MFLFVLCLTGCGGARIQELELPSEEIILARGNVALVTSEYARVFEIPSAESRVRFIARIGEIASVTGASRGQSLVRGELDYWYEVVIDEGPLLYAGWIFGADIELYATHARAQNAAGQLLSADDVRQGM